MISGVLAGIAAGALWGLVFIAPTLLPGHWFIDLAAARFAVYGAISAVALLAGHRPLLTATQALRAVGLSILGFTAFYIFLACAIVASGSALPALIVGLLPISVMMLGKPAHLQWHRVLPGLIATLLGIVLTTARLTSPPEVPVAGITKGIVLSAAALACWSAFAVLNARWLERHPEIGATDWAHWLGLGAAASSVLVWLRFGSNATTLLHSPQSSTFAVLALITGLGSTWLATICWNIASRHLGAALCGQLIVSETLFALLYSCLWTGRVPTPTQMLGSALFVVGVLVTLRAQWSIRDAERRYAKRATTDAGAQP